MPEPAKKKATYDDLFSIPDNMTGEIIAGELVVTPRPSGKHGYVAWSLGLFVQNDRVRVEPFQQALLDLSDLWLEGTPQTAA